ncbi:hypothetical protein [Fulvivirga sp.]|uniref:hypothetical protein n=1 Tax=Fulvivirga sp. TaxID=1931237 RepID=UPI0032EF27A4
MGKLNAFNFIAPYTLDQGLNDGICIHIHTKEITSFTNYISGATLKCNAPHGRVCMMLTSNLEES